MVRHRRKGKQAAVDVAMQLRSWGPRGSAVGDGDLGPVAVDRGIPGERVIAAVQRGGGKPRGTVLSVEEPSPARTDAPCLAFHRGCGGCQWQHIAYSAQVEFKRDGVERELRRAGSVASVRDVHTLDQPWRYRRTAAIALGWEAGFRPRGRRGIIRLRDCPIAHPAIGRVLHALNDLLGRGALPNFHGKVWIDTTVIGSETEPRLQLVLQGIAGLTPEANPELEGVAAALASLPRVETVAYRHRSGEVAALHGPLFGQIMVGGHLFTVPAGGFFQTNLRLLPQAFEAMKAVVASLQARQAADVYGGVGTLGLPLAGLVERMTLIELDSSAVEAARQTSAQWGLSNVTFQSRHAERALPEIESLDLAIVDPPRSGLGRAVTDALCARRVPSILYMSCAPTSLADDLAVLESGGYQVQWLDVYDFYPQTYHAECLAFLQLAN